MRKIPVFFSALLILAAFLPFSSCQRENVHTVYAITAEYAPAERTLSADMSVAYVNQTENVKEELFFLLYPNAFQEGTTPPVSPMRAPAAYYDGESYGKLEILSVDGGTYSVDGTCLCIFLDEPLYPKEEVQISMTFQTVLPKVNHRFGVGETCVNLAHFYPLLTEEGYCDVPPVGDPFVSECSDYEVSLTLPEEYSLACGGEAQTIAQTGKKTYHILSENVRDFAVVFGEGLSCSEMQVSGVTVEYWAKDEGEEGLRAAVDALAFFSRTFGQYPYEKYVVVRTDLDEGGMEYPALSMVSSALHPSEVPTVTVHETAHQWWYSAVGSNQVEEAWMDEGLAEYSTALFFDAHPTYGLGREEYVSRAERAYRAYYSVKTQLLQGADTSMRRPLSSFSNGYEYVNLAYHKSTVLFDRVRLCVGDGKFYSALKDYYREFSGKIAAAEDLIACFHRAFGHVEELFSSFLDGKCVV